ncbi:helix-hairpin-helix domain-containing protein [Salegentibacter sp. F188]|uniref:Helix-hairpin-helix domain-containing protein n=1 Tax=Autumnicola patrickiae TaxID=3075591 RepID=A0ABU3DXX6_9FLAO|nr:helix-hairpin-helix domain-containing protein [Salegentibacter sp. F188]MDT0688560.1 helix-hairpin-helix domain-containing protein [Salegentibacter sp. F188]
MKFKSHFVFNRSQRNGIFLLVCSIVVLQIIYLTVSFSSNAEEAPLSSEEIQLYQVRLDSIKLARVQNDSVRNFPFNPNYITDFKGYTLGMSTDEIDRLLRFREAGKWINSAEDFQEVTGVSDSLLNLLSPYFKFPEWVKERKASGVISAGIRPVATKDLNSASVEELIEVNGIGEVLAARIVNYRSKIGGFMDDIQLKDIYGLNYEARENLLRNYRVIDAPDFLQKNINTIGVIELSEIPYFNYELAREIVNYRKLHEGIASFEELSKINEFPSDKIDRIKLYLTLD